MLQARALYSEYIELMQENHMLDKLNPKVPDLCDATLLNCCMAARIQRTIDPPSSSLLDAVRSDGKWCVCASICDFICI